VFRRPPRAFLLWAGALTLATVTALVVGTDLATLHRRARTLGPQVAVAIAARDLTTGVTVDDGDLAVRRLHRSQLPDGVVGPAKARGRVVAVPVLEGAFVAERNLAPRHRRGLDGVVPPGMRIVQVSVAGGADDVRPGAAVDVIATFDTGSGVDADGLPSDEPTAIVARGALVLGTDDDTVTTEAGAGGGAVTVLVTREEASAVAYASAAGVVTVAIVPPEDARAALPA
jgi:Flp pilus assembly protein CpaB